MNLSFKHKLMLGIMLSICFVFGTGSTVASWLIQDRLLDQARNQMELTSQGIHASVKGMVLSSIKNYLKGLSETNLDYVKYVHGLQQSGQLTETQAKQMAANFMLRQKVADTGYMVALDCTDPSHPAIAVHPNAKLVGMGGERFPFMKDECRLKKGYFEFSVQLPGQPERLKSMWVAWFEPWKWTLGATPFKEDYPNLVDLSGIEAELSSVEMGSNSYAFIMDMDGLLLSHPQWKGRNMLGTVDAKTGAPFVRQFVDAIHLAIEREDETGYAGVHQYHIKDPTSSKIYARMMNYRYLPEVGWIVGVVTDLDELMAPAKVIRETQFTVILVSFVVAMLVVMWAVRPLTRSIDSLAMAVEEIDGGKLNAPLPEGGRDEIGRLAQSFQRMAKRLADYTENLEGLVEARTQELKAVNKELEKLSITDGLTGLSNRRSLDAFLAKECARASRIGQPLVLALVDVDCFKQFNDSYGHQKGDECLIAIADVLFHGARRTGDMAARYGGEEFALVFPDTALDVVYRRIEDIRQDIEDLQIPHETSELGVVTASFGVAAIEGEGDASPEHLIAQADAALYKAKGAGRNRVEAS